MLLSIVIPVLNEEATIPLLLARIRNTLQDVDWHVLFVDDGSSDRTAEMLDHAASEDTRVGVLHFSRNFGHQAAITAGLDCVEGDAVVVMDADLQDPPELLPKMLSLFHDGFDIVSPCRISRRTDSFFKKWSAKFFYRTMTSLAGSRFTQEVGDFRLLSRRAVWAMRSFREQHRYVRGLSSWLGLREITLPFERGARLGGRTKYSLLKMLRFGWTALTSFSAFPLRIAVGMGCILSCLGLSYLVRVIYLALWTKTLVPGWASIVALQCVFSGMFLLALGAIGDYIARIYEEAKQRPLYVISAATNASPVEQPVRALFLADADHRPLTSEEYVDDYGQVGQAYCAAQDSNNY